MSLPGRHQRWTAGLLAVLTLVASIAVWGIGPVGDEETIDPVVRGPLLDNLYDFGYLIHDDPESVKAAVGAFLWDNRDRFVNLDIQAHRRVDIAICLLNARHGRMAEFAEAEPMRSWCAVRLVPESSTGGDDDAEARQVALRAFAGYVIGVNQQLGVDNADDAKLKAVLDSMDGDDSPLEQFAESVRGQRDRLGSDVTDHLLAMADAIVRGRYGR